MAEHDAWVVTAWRRGPEYDRMIRAAAALHELEAFDMPGEHVAALMANRLSDMYEVDAHVAVLTGVAAEAALALLLPRCLAAPA